MIGYLDDFTLGGPIHALAADVDRLRSDAAKIGLELNVSKCEIICNENYKSLLCGTILENFKYVNKEMASLLGAPLLPGPAIDAALSKKCEDLQLTIDRLKRLQSHDALIILQNSLSVPKLLYVLRTSACAGHPLLQTFDDILRSGLSDILNVSITDDQWIQASLPVRHGGLGVRSVVRLASSTFLASAAGSIPYLVQILPERVADQQDNLIESTIDMWKLDSNSDPPMEAGAHVQKHWDEKVINKSKSYLFDHATDDYHKARLLATQSISAGDWLNALPLSSVGLRMDNETIRFAVALRLGSVICERHVCRCGQSVDVRGNHCLSCRSGSSKFIRHNLINDIIWRAMTRAQIPSTKEPPGLLWSDGKKLDGVSLIPWSRGRCLTWDVTVPDTVAVSHINCTCQFASSAAEQVAVNKHRKYVQLMHSHEFVAVAVETFGSWSVEGLAFVNELGKRCCAVSGDDREALFLRQRLSVALQRGNAIAFQDCLNAAFIN